MVEVRQGESVDIGTNNLPANFGMVTGSLLFRIGNFTWVPTEIWLLPREMDPSIFSKGLTQQETIELPANITGSTCRTAVYLNQSVGRGFKIYNTGTTTQIFRNGTFCGLAYEGTYFVFTRY
jgi:hypothetical protein